MTPYLSYGCRDKDSKTSQKFNSQGGWRKLLVGFLCDGLEDTAADPPDGIGFETEVSPLVVLIFCYFQSVKPSLLQFLFRQPSIKILFDDIQHYLFLIHLLTFY